MGVQSLEEDGPGEGDKLEEEVGESRGVTLSAIHWRTFENTAFLSVLLCPCLLCAGLGAAILWVILASAGAGSASPSLLSSLGLKSCPGGPVWASTLGELPYSISILSSTVWEQEYWLGWLAEGDSDRLPSLEELQVLLLKVLPDVEDSVGVGRGLESVETFGVTFFDRVSDFCAGVFISVKAASSDLLCLGVRVLGGGRKDWNGVLIASWVLAGAEAAVDLLLIGSVWSL